MLRSAAVTIEFFWDVSSPYTYLASTQVDGLVERSGETVKYRPFLLGGVFKASANVAPGANPAKATYMVGDLTRWRETYGVPMLMPVQEVVFPINSVLPMRTAIAVGEDKAREYLHAVMKAYWVDGKDVSTPDVVREVLASIGVDADATLAKTQDQAVKDELRKNSDEAVERGAFGAPTFFVGEDMYWGNDRLEMLERRLRTA